jgi:hypothetical protein
MPAAIKKYEKHSKNESQPWRCLHLLLSKDIFNEKKGGHFS